MPASSQASVSTNILSDKCGMSENEVRLDRSDKFFSSRNWPTDNVLTKNEAISKNVPMQSQGSSDIRCYPNVKIGGTNISKAGTGSKSANLSLVDKEGSWGSLESSPCSVNVFSEASASLSHNNDSVLSVKCKSLIPSPSSTDSAVNDVNRHSFNCLHNNPSCPTPVPHVTSTSETDLPRASSKKVINSLSWGEEVMISILGKDPQDFVHASPESSENSSMQLERTNSKSSFASSNHSPKLKTGEFDSEMNPVAFWKDNIRKTFFKDQNLENRMFPGKRYAMGRASSSPRNSASTKPFETESSEARVSKTKNDSKIGRPTITCELPQSTNINNQYRKNFVHKLIDLTECDSKFMRSYEKSSGSKGKGRSTLKKESKPNSLVCSSTRSNITKLFNSEPQTERLPENSGVYTPSAASMITASSTTSIPNSAEGGTKFPAKTVYPFSTKCLEMVANAQHKEQVTNSAVGQKVMPNRLEPQQYLMENNFQARMCLQQAGPIMCPQPVTGGFIAPQITAPVICIPEHQRRQQMLYTFPAGSPMILGQPLFSPVFCGLQGQPAGLLYHSPLYHQPVQFQLPTNYQQPVLQPYLVEKVEHQVRVNLPLTTENVNMHNKACGY